MNSPNETTKGHKYRALFTIRESDVLVLHVRSGRQALLSKDELEIPDDDEFGGS